MVRGISTAQFATLIMIRDYFWILFLGFPESLQDFSPDAIAVTVEADEDGSQKNDVDVQIPIVNDEFDEADEEVFILVVSVQGSNDESSGRRSSLCIIQDDDGL